MNNFVSMYSGISGHAHASAYSNSVKPIKEKQSSKLDSLQDAIGTHRSAVNNRYSNIL